MSGGAKRFDCLVGRKYKARDGSEKTNWTKIGVAFEGRDGGMNVTLDAFPVGGGFIIREPKEYDPSQQRGGSRGGGGGAARGGGGFDDADYGAGMNSPPAGDDDVPF
jgi:hypothetical protein